MKRTILIALSTCALLFAVAHAQQKRPTLTAQDYAEIQQLYAQYSHGIDSGADDGLMFARVFTPDGALIAPTGTTEGREKLAELARRGKKSPTNVRHWAVNVLIEPSPEGANGSAYVLLVNIGESGQPSGVMGGGIYRDVIVKTSEGWRIKKRAYYPAGSTVPAP